MGTPTLRLEMVQGPRAGEALEFKPGKKVGIGRLVRGNAIQIKDDGVSSKHLRIEFVSGKWLITDLDSSNGTFLNGATVDPLFPTLLRNGDVVKIGESTSIIVRLRVEDESKDVVCESSVRRNPRRRAAVAAKDAIAESVGLVRSKRAKATDGHVGCGGGVDLDLDEKKKLEETNGGDLVAEKKGRKGASKRNNVKKVDDNRPELQIIEDSDAKLEIRDEVVEAGRRRLGRPKKVNTLKSEGEAAESVLAGDEGLKDGSQSVKESRRERGVRKGREKEGCVVVESVVAALEPNEVPTHLAESSRDGRGSMRRSDRALSKTTAEVELNMVDGNSEKPLQSVQVEDGIKKQTRGRPGKAKVVSNVVVKDRYEVKAIVNSESSAHEKPVNIKKEKVSMCPSTVADSLCVHNRGSVLENETSLDEGQEAVKNGVSDKLNHDIEVDLHDKLEDAEILISENMKNLDSHDPLEAASIHFSVEENEVMSQSHKKKDINNSEKEISENHQNFDKEKLSACPSMHKKVPETLCMNSSGSEFGNKGNSKHDELMATDDGLSEKIGDKAALESNESPEAADVFLDVAGNAERIDSARKASEGFQAEPGCQGSHSWRGGEVNLEKMTLGEWFDYLEATLPRQIHDATEEMIASMIEKSKKVQEYVSHHHQQKEKGNGLAGKGT